MNSYNRYIESRTLSLPLYYILLPLAPPQLGIEFCWYGNCYQNPL